MALQIDFEQEELHDFLRIDLGMDDLIIDIMKDTAVTEAEQFLNTDFSMQIANDLTNPDGTTTTTITVTQGDIPAPIKMWVLMRIAQLYENRGQGTTPDYTLIQQYRVYPFRG